MLQLNSALTKTLANNIARFGTSARLIFVKDTVAIPADLSTSALDAYFQSFMLSSNASNYLGSVAITGYQNFNNTIIYGVASANALQTGTVGSVVCVYATSTGAPVASTSSTGYLNARNRCFFITDSISTIDDPKTVVIDSLALTSGVAFQHYSTTISMVSAM